MQTVPFVPFAVDPIFGESDAEDLLPGIPVEQIGRGKRQMSAEAHSILQTSSGTSTPSTSVLAALKSVLPDSINKEVLPSSSIVRQDMKVFTAPLQRHILFSVANNFAGVGSSDMGSVYRFLRTEMDETLYRLILYSPGYSSRAIAQNIFKVAIEAGDASIVDLLLTDRLADINLNRQLYLVDGQSLTPIEWASSLRHAGVIRALLRHHADVNQTLRRDSYLGGALNSAIGKHSPLYDRVDPEIFRTLLQAGGDLSDVQMSYIINVRDSEFLSLIISKNARKNVTKWSGWGVFQKAVTFLQEQESIDIIKVMLDVGADLDYSYGAYQNTTAPRRVIDVAAQRGSLEMVKVLLNNGASLSDDTLTRAVESTNQDLIRFLLEKGANINSRGPQGTTAFEEALKVRNAPVINLLQEHGAFVDVENYQYVYASLQAASKTGDVVLAKHLLQLQCQISPEDLGCTLVEATRGGFEEVAMLLLDAGAKSNWSLVYAVESCSLALVLALLDAGTEPNYSGNVSDSSTPLQIAIKNGNRPVIDALLLAGADVNCASASATGGKTALTLAVAQKDCELVQLLLDFGADVNIRNSDFPDTTTLRTAAEGGDLMMAQLLLDRGADPHDSKALSGARLQNRKLFELLIKEHKVRYPRGRKGFGSEALAQAIEKSEECDVRVLLEIGENGDTMIKYHDQLVTPFGHELVTPFGLAILNEKNGVHGFTELFLLKGYDPNGIVSEILYERTGCFRLRTTALLAAVGTQNASTVELLIRHGANCNLAAWGPVKRTPLQRAAEIGSINLVELLLNHGANVNGPAARGGGGTALQLAAIGGYIPIACMLLDRKADVDAPGSKADGRTALEGAAEHGRLDMVQLLLNAEAGSSGKDLAQFARAKALAKENGHFHISDLLDSHTKSPNQFSQLDRAVDDDYESMVNWSGNEN